MQVNQKVLFCSKHFPAACFFTRQALNGLGQHYIVEQCEEKRLEEEIQDAVVVVPFMVRITDQVLQQASWLRLVIQYGVGLEGVDIPAASRRGIYVAKIPSADNGNAQSCAEHAIFLALALLRDFSGLQTSICDGRLGYPLGRTLFASKVVIFGFGGIGRALLPRLLAFGSQVIVVRRQLDNEDKDSENVQYITINSFFQDVHNISVCFMCCVQNNETKGIVDQKFLSCLAPGTVLVNVARVSIFCMYVFISLLIYHLVIYREDS
jgi:phosphoglycerate dehydrogenase-like enzyme